MIAFVTLKWALRAAMFALAVPTGTSWSLPPSLGDTHPTKESSLSRRFVLETAPISIAALISGGPAAVFAEEGGEVEVTAVGDAKKLFNEGRALESQGNMAAAQRLYAKVTKISPRFIYGWSNLGNTQTAFGDLNDAEESYSTAIDLCYENLRTTQEGFGQRRCSDLYVLLLNRGSLRLNNGRPKDALEDLQQSYIARSRPDAIILQNLARAKELNGLYGQADRDYTTAIAMTANEVNPFWLRAAMVKLQIGDVQSGLDLLKRVENRFPEAPEVRAASAAFLAAKGKQIDAQQKYLEIPDRQRAKYVDSNYLTKVISWPPAMREELNKVTTAVGDKPPVTI